MRAIVAVVLLALVGCVSNVDRTLDAATLAEKRIGKSGSVALEGVATLTTTLAASAATLTSSLVVAGDRLDAAIDKAGARAAVTLDRLSATLDGASAATSNIAAIVSDARPAAQALGPTMTNLAAVVSEARGITADARANVESGWLSKRLLIGAVIVVVLTLAHSIIAHWRLSGHLKRIHAKLPKE